MTYRYGLGARLLSGEGLLAPQKSPPPLEDRRKRAAWEKAHPVTGFDPNLTRKDAFGWWIEWAAHGDRESAFGWEIDHSHPTALGGGDGLSNLRALHWRNNARLGGLLRSALR